MQYVAFGSVALGIGIALYALKVYGKTLNIMFLLAGAALSPTLSGWIGPALNSVGGVLFGIGVSVVCAAAAITWVFMEFKRNGKHKKTPWIALLIPSLMLASGLPIFTKVTNMTDQVLRQGNQAVTQAK